LPLRRLWPRLALTAVGVVVGFPLFSAWALTLVPAAHAAVIAGLLPAATAVMAVLRSGERPRAAFWAATLLGLIAVLVFATTQGSDARNSPTLSSLSPCCWAGGAMPRAARSLASWAPGK
jgi:drug/metabolite transporter (DMT)-like permease